jgi:hypothetical protein
MAAGRPKKKRAIDDFCAANKNAVFLKKIAKTR